MEQLEYILAVADEGTVTAASRKLNISHPAVSRGISNLEEELGITIFTRSRSGMEATEEGKLVLESARRILAEVQRLHELLGRKPEHQLLSVAVFPIDAFFFLPEVISVFREQCDYARMSFHHMEISEAMAKVRGQQMTFGLCAFAQKGLEAAREEFHVVPLFESCYAVGCGSNVELPDKGYLTVDEVRNYSLILHDDPVISSALTELFGDVSTLDILMYSNDNALIKRMVAEGRALSIHTMFLSKSGSEINNGDIQLIPLGNSEKETAESDQRMQVVCGLFYPNKKHLNRAERLFIQILKERTAEWR